MAEDSDGNFIPNPATVSKISQSLSKNVEESAGLLSAWENTDVHLYEVLAETYNNNPTLLARRAEFMAVKEQLPQAQSGFKPNVNGNASITYAKTKTEGENFFGTEGGRTAKNIELSLEQPLFKGGSTLANIKGANAVIAAQRALTYSNEQNVMLEAVTAYVDVMLSQASLELTQNNMSLIELELRQSQARFDVGELTRTDVAQAKARLALAESNLTQAKGDLNSNIALYQEITGVAPDMDSMALPISVLELPESKEEAMRLAELQNLSVILAENTEIAAQYDIDSVFGELLPQLSATSSLGRDYTPYSFVDEQSSLSVGVKATLPLYQSGATRSRLRQAKQVANQRFLEVHEVKNEARREAATNYALWLTAKAEIKSRKAQVEAATVAREGVQYEAEFGERTTLDTLDANQELLNAQLDLIKSKRNEVVTRFSLAKTLGILTPQNLDLYEDR